MFTYTYATVLVVPAAAPSRFPVWRETADRPFPSESALAWEKRESRPALYLRKSS